MWLTNVETTVLKILSSEKFYLPLQRVWIHYTENMLSIIFRIKPKGIFIVLFFPFLKLCGLKIVLDKISPALNYYF